MKFNLFHLCFVLAAVKCISMENNMQLSESLSIHPARGISHNFVSSSQNSTNKAGTLCTRYSKASIVGSGERIAGGNVASSNEYPWQVLLEIYAKNNRHYVCGGSLISSQWVLTSANCLDGALSINTYLGAHNICQNEAQRIMYTSNVFIQHPRWNNQTLDGDIALIKLPYPVNFNEYIKPIGLPPYDDPSHEGDTVFLTGWGRTTGNLLEPLSSVLRETSATVMSNTDCGRVYGNVVTSDVICSSGDGRNGICASDIGGPMNFRKNDGAFIQIGIASFYSLNGCENRDPSGFTRLRNYLSWISQQSGVTPNGSESVNRKSNIGFFLVFFILYKLISNN